MQPLKVLPSFYTLGDCVYVLWYKSAVCVALFVYSTVVHTKLNHRSMLYIMGLTQHSQYYELGSEGTVPIVSVQRTEQVT